MCGDNDDKMEMSRRPRYDARSARIYACRSMSGDLHEIRARSLYVVSDNDHSVWGQRIRGARTRGICVLQAGLPYAP